MRCTSTVSVCFFSIDDDANAFGTFVYIHFVKPCKRCIKQRIKIFFYMRIKKNTPENAEEKRPGKICGTSFAQRMLSTLSN